MSADPSLGFDPEEEEAWHATQLAAVPGEADLAPEGDEPDDDTLPLDDRARYAEEFAAQPGLFHAVKHELIRVRAREIVSDVRAAAESDDESLERVDLLPYLTGEIEPVTPNVLQRDDDQSLLYSGRYNGFYGDSGIGKTFLEAVTMAAAIEAGHHVMYIDFEEPSPASLIERICQIGVSDEARDAEGRWHRADTELDIIRERLHYYHPAVALTDRWIAERVAEANEYSIVFIGVDSLGEAFAIHGVNEDRDNEVGPWLRRYMRPLADETNGALTSTDHSTKAAENPLYPSGSKRKRAAITGALYYVEAVEPVTRENGGRLRLTTAKDRHGWHRHGDPAAILDLRPPKPICSSRWSVKLWTPRPNTSGPENADMRIASMAEIAVAILKRKGPLQKSDLMIAMGTGDDKVKRAGMGLLHDRVTGSVRPLGSRVGS
jgi:hypothetical protein